MFNTIFSNTLSTFNRLIGREYYRYRVVFYQNGLEIAFVSDSLFGSTRTYIDGNQVDHRWPPLADFYGNTRFTWNGVDYRIRHQMTNPLTCAQSLTLFVDGAEVQRKYDPRFGSLSFAQMAHMTLGLVVFGLAIGLVLKAFGA